MRRVKRRIETKVDNKESEGGHRNENARVVEGRSMDQVSNNEQKIQQNG